MDHESDASGVIRYLYSLMVDLDVKNIALIDEGNPAIEPFIMLNCALFVDYTGSNFVFYKDKVIDLTNEEDIKKQILAAVRRTNKIGYA